MWQIKWEKKAEKNLNKLDPQVKRFILEYLKDLVKELPHPKDIAKPITKVRPLRRDRVGLWKIRINDYRLICKIEDHRLIIIVLNVDHRKEVYED